jgi:hypothetical protein
VFADFDGSDPILGTTGTQEVGLDPQTGEQIITMKEPLGGWRWAVTGSTNLPQTIQGYVLVDNGVTGWIGLAIFDNPITLTEIGQQIDIGFATFRVVLQPLS